MKRGTMKDVIYLALLIVALFKPPDLFFKKVEAQTWRMPSGSVMILSSGVCPANYTEMSALDGQTLVGTLAAHGNVGTTGGSNSITVTGSVTAPTFTGNSGTIPAETFTGSSATTSSVSGGTPAGTNASGAFTAGAISWPAGVPTFSGSALGTHTHTPGTFADATSGSGVKLFTASGSGVSAATLSGTSSATSAGTPAGTVAWPAGVPTIAAGVFTQPTFAGSALAGHTHTLTATGTNGTVSFTPAGTNSAPTFTADSFDPHPAFVRLIFCQSV